MYTFLLQTSASTPRRPPIQMDEECLENYLQYILNFSVSLLESNVAVDLKAIRLDRKSFQGL